MAGAPPQSDQHEREDDYAHRPVKVEGRQAFRLVYAHHGEAMDE
jgi:hypothetical protein